MKTCSGCGQAKSPSEMTKAGIRCKACQAAADRAYYAANPERRRKQKVAARRRELLKTYGITQARYDELVAAQDGHCAICDRVAPLQVDHCHTTGDVRFLLCGRCNRGLGLFDDSIPVLEAAIRYLQVTRSP